MKSVRIFAVAAASAAVLAVSGRGGVTAQQPAQPANDIHVMPIKGNIWMINAAGSNVVASIGKDGVVLVDTGAAAVTDRLLATIQLLDRQVTAMRMPQQSCVGLVQGCGWWNSSTFLTTTAAPPPPKPVVGIINTSFDPDHMGGNARLALIGRSNLRNAPADAWIIAHEKAPSHQPKSAPIPLTALPSESYEGDSFKLNFLNGEGVVLWHMPAAHTDGDTIVYFHRSDVIAAGDVFSTESYPVIDIARGGSVQGVLAALDTIVELAIPDVDHEGGTMIVPGHGYLADEFDVAEYRDMITIVRDRIQDMLNGGMTRQQIQAARPTFDWDARYGAESGEWTTAMFVDAVITSLSGDAR